MAKVTYHVEVERAILTSAEAERYLTGLALQVERAAKRYCAVDTGRLRSSISHGIRRDPGGLLAVVGTNVDYAPYVEFGTRYMAAQPFLRPALRSVR